MALVHEYSHKVYYRNEIEYNLVKETANKLGLKVSTWLRDISIAEIRRLNIAQDIQQQLTQAAASYKPHANDPDPLVPDPATGKMVPLSSLTLVFGNDKEKVDWSEILNPKEDKDKE